MLEHSQDAAECVINIIDEESNLLSATANVEMSDSAREILRGLTYALANALLDYLDESEGVFDLTLRVELENGAVTNVGLYGDDDSSSVSELDADDAEAVQRKAMKYAQRIAEEFDVDADELATRVAEVTADALVAESEEDEDDQEEA